ncbi:hypothetical protein H2203_001539 [Taxawa tesnikishii (nom. ined.)]|nr:hypothetical protein H2203_001539 [Dothideales sp. JES 119]
MSPKKENPASGEPVGARELFMDQCKAKKNRNDREIRRRRQELVKEHKMRVDRMRADIRAMGKDEPSTEQSARRKEQLEKLGELVEERARIGREMNQSITRLEAAINKTAAAVQICLGHRLELTRRSS